MKRISIIVLIFMVIGLTSCKVEDTRVVTENEIIYDFISTKSIDVNEETFITFCKHDKDEENGIRNTFLSTIEYTDDDGKVYTSAAISSCSVFYSDTMYHGFELLEDGILTIEELDLLEFPFSEKED